MSYRREDIPGMIECLQQAKADVTSRTFVCICVDRTDHEKADLVTDMIRESLEGHYVLRGFIKEKSRRTPSNKAMYSIRIRWIDKMIHDLQQYAKATPDAH